MSDAEKVGEAIRRALPLIGPEAREEASKLLDPLVLATVAGVLTAWVISHFVGIGEIVDVILLAAGVFAIGMSVFDGVSELFQFANAALHASGESDLDNAAKHFADAVAILGIQAVLSVLLRSAPRTFRGGRVKVGAPPPFARGAVSRPPLRSTRALPPAHGETGAWGDIVISRLGTSQDRRIAALHENVHRVLTPKLNALRTFRISNRSSSYARSALSKYLEEALAETIAQVGVNGFGSAFSGIAFPVKNGYVTIFREVVRNGRVLRPFGPELGGICASGFGIGGTRYEIRWSMMKPRPVEGLE
jgi:hypothetical protein